jgi:hypothetical protein
MKLRSPKAASDMFVSVARRLGFVGLRRSRLTLACPSMSLPRDADVTQRLLRSYAKRTRKADRSATGVIGALSRGISENEPGMG